MQHNPDHLTPEQYGAVDGYRLLDHDEILDHERQQKDYIWLSVEEIENYLPSRKVWSNGYAGDTASFTYRTKLSREELAAARAKLKADYIASLK